MEPKLNQKTFREHVAEYYDTSNPDEILAALEKELKSLREEVSIKQGKFLWSQIGDMTLIRDDEKPDIEYGQYLVVLRNGTKKLEIYNGTGWAYNSKDIIGYYVPKIK